jgi:polyhydroxyalkanoate synthase
MRTDSKLSGGLDAKWHAALGQLTGGLSPTAIATAYMDWWLHLTDSPQKMKRALDSGAAPDQNDPRFKDPAWESFPYNVLSQNFLAA